MKGENGEKKAITRSEAKIKRRWESKFHCGKQDVVNSLTLDVRNDIIGDKKKKILLNCKMIFRKKRRVIG